MSASVRSETGFVAGLHRRSHRNQLVPQPEHLSLASPDLGDSLVPWSVVVQGRPASIQSKPKTKQVWQIAVKAAAKAAWGSSGPVTADVAVRMIYFTTAPTQGDVDNRIKWTLDALNKVVYQDDKQVVQVLAAEVLQNQTLNLGFAPPILLQALAANNDFVFLMVQDPASVGRLLQ